MRVMLDTNVFDRLERDDEAASELENRRDLRLIISEIQLQQLTAIPDEERRSRYLGLAARLCATVSAAASRSAAVGPGQPGSSADRHEPDRLIAAAAAARCDLLVTNDKGLLEYAGGEGIRAMTWKYFVDHLVFRR